MTSLIVRFFPLALVLFSLGEANACQSQQQQQYFQQAQHLVPIVLLKRGEQSGVYVSGGKIRVSCFSTLTISQECGCNADRQACLEAKSRSSHAVGSDGRETYVIESSENSPVNIGGVYFACLPEQVQQCQTQCPQQ